MSIPRYPAVPEGTKLGDYPRATPEEQVERMAAFRKIVQEHQFQPVRWIDRQGKKRQTSVDALSANVVCRVYDHVDDDFKSGLCAHEPPVIVRIAMRAAG